MADNFIKTEKKKKITKAKHDNEKKEKNCNDDEEDVDKTEPPMKKDDKEEDDDIVEPPVKKVEKKKNEDVPPVKKEEKKKDIEEQPIKDKIILEEKKKEDVKVTIEDDQKKMIPRTLKIFGIPPETATKDLYNLFRSYQPANIHIQYAPFGVKNNGKDGNTGIIIFKSPASLQKFLDDKKEYRLGTFKLRFEKAEHTIIIPKNRALSVGLLSPNVDDDVISKWATEYFKKFGLINHIRIMLDVHANKFVVIKFDYYLDYVDALSYCHENVIEFKLPDNRIKELTVRPAIEHKYFQYPPYRGRGRGRGYGRGRGLRGRGGFEHHPFSHIQGVTSPQKDDE